MPKLIAKPRVNNPSMKFMPNSHRRKILKHIRISEKVPKMKQFSKYSYNTANGIFYTNKNKTGDR